VPSDKPHLSDDERAVLSLATEDAYALWEVAHEVGGDLAVAANVVENLLLLGLVELGVEDWTDGHLATHRGWQVPRNPIHRRSRRCAR